MITKDTINPFGPGRGEIPPYFSGREMEQHHLRALINELKQQVSPSKDTILNAPRGYGKTALLNWLIETVRTEEKDNIDIIKISPTETGIHETEIHTEADLINRVALPDWIERLQEKTGLDISFELRGLQTKEDTKSKKRRQISPHLLSEELMRRCSQKPTILIVDQAHTLNPRIGAKLLNTSQKIKNEVPFELIMAGNPGLLNHLKKIDATFWERNDILMPGLLSYKEAYKALAEPMETLQVTGGQKILEELAQDSQGYPLFTQLYGAQLFKRLQLKETGHIDNKIAKQALKDIRVRQENFYENRYEGLDELELIEIATTLAEHYETQQVVSENEIREILNSVTLPERYTTESAQQELLNEGYIWRADPSDQKVFHPGIPSVMKYIRNRARSYFLSEKIFYFRF